jgi:hypothetical protein
MTLKLVVEQDIPPFYSGADQVKPNKRGTLAVSFLLRTLLLPLTFGKIKSLPIAVLHLKLVK